MIEKQKKTKSYLKEQKIYFKISKKRYNPLSLWGCVFQVQVDFIWKGLGAKREEQV